MGGHCQEGGFCFTGHPRVQGKNPREREKRRSQPGPPQKQQILHYSFPRMPLSEIKKALYWELQEDIKLEEYYYTYTLKDEKENYNLKVNLIGKALVDLWQQLAKEQNINL